MGVDWMRTKQLNISSLLILLALIVTIPLSSVRAQDEIPPEETPQPTEVSVDVVNEYYTALTTRTADGTLLTADVINGPPEPPDPVAWEASRVAVSSLDRAATLLPNFPSYSWVYGCSAVSGAMIAGYYDNNGYPNMYAGPTNGGVMPQTDTAWPTWRDEVNALYPNNPLIASQMGIDGQITEGSIDDYWVSADSTGPEPWEGGSQHNWGTAIGDFMKTSQYSFPYRNIDGSTRFWNYDNGAKLFCSQMENSMVSNSDFPDDPSYYIYRDDGTYGRKEFYEARGYAVTECFNQRTDNNAPDPNGFSLVDFQNEINAGHPVFINLQGHSVVGFGYDGSTIYIRDTWDNNPSAIYEMPWGGSYQGRAMLSVSIVHLEEASSSFHKLSPANQPSNLDPSSVTLSWETSIGAVDYEYCLSDSESCSSWTPNGGSTSVTLHDLTGGATFYWQARAKDGGGAVIAYADGAGGAEGVYWNFTTSNPALMTEQAFIPLILK
jgi:hypothetical protein